MDQMNLQRLAEIGAAQRLAEIDQERAALLRSFPALRGGSAARSRPATARGAKPAAPRRRRSRMSADARKAVSLRMKKYWAERRKTKTDKAPNRAKAKA